MTLLFLLTNLGSVPGSIALVCALQRQPVACGLLRPDGSPKALHTPRAPRSYMSDETDETGQTGETDEGRVVFDSQADACTARHGMPATSCGFSSMRGSGQTATTH